MHEPAPLCPLQALWDPLRVPLSSVPMSSPHRPRVLAPALAHHLLQNNVEGPLQLTLRAAGAPGVPQAMRIGKCRR